MLEGEGEIALKLHQQMFEKVNKKLPKRLPTSNIKVTKCCDKICVCMTSVVVFDHSIFNTLQF